MQKNDSSDIKFAIHTIPAYKIPFRLETTTARFLWMVDSKNVKPTGEYSKAFQLSSFQHLKHLSPIYCEVLPGRYRWRTEWRFKLQTIACLHENIKTQTQLVAIMPKWFHKTYLPVTVSKVFRLSSPKKIWEPKNCLEGGIYWLSTTFIHSIT